MKKLSKKYQVSAVDKFGQTVALSGTTRFNQKKEALAAVENGELSIPANCAMTVSEVHEVSEVKEENSK